MLIHNWAVSSIESFIDKAPKTMLFTKPMYYQKKLQAFFKNEPLGIPFKNFLILAIEVHDTVIKHN